MKMSVWKKENLVRIYINGVAGDNEKIWIEKKEISEVGVNWVVVCDNRESVYSLGRELCNDGSIYKMIEGKIPNAQKMTFDQLCEAVAKLPVEVEEKKEEKKNSSEVVAWNKDFAKAKKQLNQENAKIIADFQNGKITESEMGEKMASLKKSFNEKFSA